MSDPTRARFDWASAGAVLDLACGVPLGWLANSGEQAPPDLQQPLSDQRPLDAP